MWLLYTIGGVALAFFIFVFIAALSERLRLKGDLAPVSEPFPRKPAPYWLETREEARRLGMRHGGDFANMKSLIKGLQSLWVTQDRHVLVAIDAGSSAGSVKKLLSARASKMAASSNLQITPVCRTWAALSTRPY